MEVLRKNDRGDAVASLQRKLRMVGFDLLDDGVLGPATEGRIRNFQREHGLQADGVVGPRTWAGLLEKAYSFPPFPVEWVSPLSEDKYMPTYQDKRAIYLHHTAGGYNPRGTLDWWESQAERVATAFIVGRRRDAGDTRGTDGKTLRVFDPGHWAYHLGLRTQNNDLLNATTIGIELCNLGPLEEHGGRFYKVFRGGERIPVPEEDVCLLDAPWRGYRAFHKYTEAQIVECERLVLSLLKQYRIPLAAVVYSPAWFAEQADALAGKPGLWTHVNVRSDKTDCYPDPGLIDMLNGLHDKVKAFEVEVSRDLMLGEPPALDEGERRYYHYTLD